MSRRTIVVFAASAAVVVLLLVILARLNARPAPLTKLKFIAFSRPLAFAVAQQKGYFAREGLDVEYVQTPNSKTQIRGLLDGTWELGSTAADNVMAYVEAEKADLMIFLVPELGLNQKLFVQPDITAYEQLRGKVLGVDAIDTGYAYVLRKMLQKQGMGAADYQLESVGGTAQRLDALRAHKVAGALLSPPIEDDARREGFRLLQPASDVFPTYPASVAATTHRWASAHRDLVLAYIRAYQQAAEWANDPAHKDQAIDVMAKDGNVSREVATGRYELERSSVSAVNPNEQDVTNGLQAVLDLRWEMAHMSGAKPQLSKYYDASYLTAAHK